MRITRCPAPNLPIQNRVSKEPIPKKIMRLQTTGTAVDTGSNRLSENLISIPLSRRRFLGGAAAWATVSILPGRVLGAGGQTPPSKQVTLGFIGVGWRGGSHAQWGVLAGFIPNPKCRVLAVCDVNRLRAEEAKTFVDQKYGNRDCATYRDFRELLVREDIDAVVIATPLHWHAVMTILACQHGKDVYCEKPLAYTIRQGRAMVEAARRYGRVVQNGTQARSSRKQEYLCRLVREDNLRLNQLLVGWGGQRIFPELQRLPAQLVPEYLDWDMWVGPAEWRPYNAELYRMDGWRQCISYGNMVGPDMTAHTFDVAQWALGMDHTGPVEIHPPEKKDTKRQLLGFKYANGVEVLHHDDEFGPDRLRTTGMVFDCTEGIIKISPQIDTIEFDPPSFATKFRLRNDSGAQNVNNFCAAHFDNFLDCVRTRRKPNADVEIGQRSLTCAHLATIGYRLNRPLRWDPVKEDFVNDPEASRYLDTALRAPWRI
jgi:predicted dehydrogenase